MIGRTRIFVSTRERFNARRGVRGRDPHIALSDVWSGMEPHGFAVDVMTRAIPEREQPEGVVLFINQGLDKADAAIMRYAVDWARAQGVKTGFDL